MEFNNEQSSHLHKISFKGVLAVVTGYLVQEARPLQWLFWPVNPKPEKLSNWEAIGVEGTMYASASAKITPLSVMSIQGLFESSGERFMEVRHVSAPFNKAPHGQMVKITLRFLSRWEILVFKIKRTFEHGYRPRSSGPGFTEDDIMAGALGPRVVSRNTVA